MHESRRHHGKEDVYSVPLTRSADTKQGKILVKMGDPPTSESLSDIWMLKTLQRVASSNSDPFQGLHLSPQ